MDFGVQINGPALSEVRDIAQTAEAVGFRTVYFPDHLVLEGPERQAQGFPAYDPMISAAVVATATTRIRMGQLVLCNLFRHPAITARSLATLDELSNGRAVLGLGSGWTETEFRMTGIDFPEIGPRLRMLDEALTCIRGLWGDAPFSYDGEFYHFREASLTPRPVQRPHPPIILGGAGKGLLRIAAKHADVVNIVAETGRQGYISLAKAAKLTDESFREKIRFLHGEAVAAGRDPRQVRVSGVIFTLSVTESRADAQGMAAAVGGMFGVSPEFILSSPLFLIGTPEDIVNELRRREREWGLSEAIVAGQFTLETLERFGKEVVPHFTRGMSARVQVIGSYVSPYVRKVLVVLNVKGIEYEIDPIVPFYGDERFARLSPLRRIPVLIDGDVVLSDSSVICQYLEDRWPEPAVYPRDVADRARARWIEEFADTRMGDVFIWRYFNQLIIRRFVWGEETDQALVARTLAEDVPAVLEYLETLAPAAGFLFGALSIADISVATFLRNAAFARFEVDAARWPRTAAYVARVLASDGFRRLAPFEERLLRTPIPQVREALAEMGAPLTRETYAAPEPRRGVMPLA